MIRIVVESSATSGLTGLKRESLKSCDLLGVRLSTIALLLILIVPFFTILFNGGQVILAMEAVPLLLLVAASAHKEIKVSTSVGMLIAALLLFYVFVVVNNNLSLSGGSGRTWLVQFGCTVGALILLLFLRGDRWEHIALVLIALFGLFYSSATIIFWLFPDAYDAIYPTLQGMSQSIIAGRGYRAGLTTHYSTNGMYTALGFISSACLALGGRKKWGVATIVCLLGLVLTSKRAHLAFGCAVFALVYLVFNSRKKLGSTAKLLLIAALAVLTLYAISFFNEDILRVIERFNMLQDDDNFGNRSGFYELCLRMWNESPVVGNGWGSYTHMFNMTSEGMRYQMQGFMNMNAHNVFLQILAEEGIIGLILFAYVLTGSIILAIKNLLELNKHINNIEDCADFGERRLLAGSLAIQLFFAMYCITGNPLYDDQMFIPWLISLAIAYSISSGSSVAGAFVGISSKQGQGGGFHGQLLA